MDRVGQCRARPDRPGRRARRRSVLCIGVMSALPSALAEIVDDFAAVGASDKLTLLLEFSRELPPLPAELEQSAMEPVPECQSPLFLSVDDSDRDNVRLYFSAP